MHDDLQESWEPDTFVAQPVPSCLFREAAPPVKAPVKAPTPPPKPVARPAPIVSRKPVDDDDDDDEKPKGGFFGLFGGAKK